jgi:putative oxidoreductase
MTTTVMTDATRPNRALRACLWTVQVLLALAFVSAGFMKLTTPIDQLVVRMPWVADVGVLVRFIGAAEIAGALGLVLPAATRIQPRLTPLAAAGLVTVMVLAALMHIQRGELGVLPVNVLLGGLAAFVAWGRAVRAPIRPRT